MGSFAKSHKYFIISYTTYMRINADCRQDDITGDEVDILRAGDMGQDGSVVLAGTGAYDFQVIKLDADGSFMWRFQVRTNTVYRPFAPLTNRR